MRLVLSLFLSALVAAITVYFLAPSATNQTKVGISQPVYQRVKGSGVLKCGYVPYAPYLMKDPVTGEMTGIFYELTERMGELMNLKIDWSFETSFANHPEDLVAMRFDAYCGGLWPRAELATKLDYTMPVNYVGVGIYVRSDDTRFDEDYTILNDPAYSIATVDGEIGDIIRGEDFQQAGIVSLPAISDVSEGILNVTTSKADAVFTETAVAGKYLIANPGTIKNVAKTPIRLFGNTWAVRDGETDLVNAMNTALQEMLYNGFVRKVVAKYEEVPGSFFPVALPYERVN